MKWVFSSLDLFKHVAGMQQASACWDIETNGFIRILSTQFLSVYVLCRLACVGGGEGRVSLILVHQVVFFFFVSVRFKTIDRERRYDCLQT